MLVMILFCLLMISTPTADAEERPMPRCWPGYAILGNGAVCAVYSDHPGPFKQSALRGIQHLYYRDFTADYVASTDLEVIGPSGAVCPRDLPLPDSVGMEDAYTAYAEHRISGLGEFEKRARAHPDEAILLNYRVPGIAPDHSFRFRARLLRRIHTDRIILLDRSEILPGGAVFTWTNGVSLAVGTHSGDGQASIDAMGLSISGPLESGAVTVGTFVPPGRPASTDRSRPT